MALRKRKKTASGPPIWIITFADMMALLLCFFILLASFSTPDRKKMDQLTESIQDAFQRDGSRNVRGALDQNTYPKSATAPEGAPTVHSPAMLGSLSDRELARFSMTYTQAAATLRQAMQAMPDLTDISRHVLIEETRNGLQIQLTDQDGRSMFEPGSMIPREHTRLILQTLAPALSELPHLISITGHTSGTADEQSASIDAWELSTNRANATRKLLLSNGLDPARVEQVAGRADTDPLFPDNPALAANRRVTILLRAKPPPLPLDPL